MKGILKSCLSKLRQTPRLEQVEANVRQVAGLVQDLEQFAQQVTALELQKLVHQHQAVLTRIAVLEQNLILQNQKWTLRLADTLSQGARTLLQQRHDHCRELRALRADWSTQVAEGPPPVLSSQPYQEGLDKLKKAYPHAFMHWHKLLTVNEDAYAGLPTDSCSAAGHPVAPYFGYFAEPYLRHRVLDIGCGPQAKPVYLEEYPSELISGLDPLDEAEPHPFQFVKGVAELLPWAQGTFGAVVAATSLDHVLSLDMTFQEIVRVLQPDGVFLTWVAFMEQAAPYDPADPHLQPIDAFHLFHFTQSFFEESVSRYFTIRDVVQFDLQSHFYCLTPRKTVACAA